MRGVQSEVNGQHAYDAAVHAVFVGKEGFDSSEGTVIS